MNSNGNYKIVITKAAQKDKAKIKTLPALRNKVDILLEILKNNPYKTPPPYEKLIGDFSSCYSRRINRQHRLVYMVDEAQKTVKIIAMWTHYE